MNDRIRPSHTFPGWLGFFGAGLAWYAAHDLSFYLTRFNCAGHPWTTPLLHLVALAVALASAVPSLRILGRTSPGDTSADVDRFAAMIGLAAAALFSLVIVWQGAATLIYSGCER